MSYNIYASSPGILVTAADFTAAGAAGPVVLLPYASSIGYELTVKDGAGLASVATPITVSTIVDAYYARTLSTSIISSVQITQAGGSVAVAPLQPRTYTLLHGPLVQRLVPSALRPNTESISTISTYTATALSSLILQPTVSLNTLLSFSAPASLTAEFTSTITSALQTSNLYSAYTTGPDPGSVLSYFSTGSLSTNIAYADSLSGAAITTSNFTGVGFVDICGSGLTSVGGNYSTIRGSLLTTDSSARITGNTLVRGAFSTLGSVVAYGTGGVQVRNNFNGGSNISVGSLVAASAASFGSNFYAASTVLSTFVVHSGAAYTSSIAIGKLNASNTWDVSGSMFVTASLTESSAIQAVIVSTATLQCSTFNVYNNTSNIFSPLYIQGGNLYYAGSQVGSGGVPDYAVSQTIVSSFVRTTNLYASSAFIGPSTYTTNFTLEVNGGIKITDTSGARLRVAGGAIASGDTTTTLAWSENGISWAKATAGGFTTAAYGLGWNGRQWLALGADTVGQTIEVSLNGKSWSASGVTNPFAAEGHAAAWNGERWVAVGAGSGTNTIKTSTDGYNWTDAASGGFSNFGYDVGWNGRLWIALGNSNASAHSIQYSYDASNWSNVTSGSFDISGMALAWNGRLWVAVGSATTLNARIKWSADGLTWTDSSGATAFSGFGSDVVWSGQVFMATGSDTTRNNRIKFSYDGSLWSNSSGTAFDGSGQAITYDGDKWIAGGTDTTQNARIKYSVNGRNWINASGVQFAAGGTNAIAYGYDTVPRLQVAGLEFYDGVNPYLRSTNTIFTQRSLFNSSITHSTSMVINNTLYINPPTGVAINIDPSILGSTIALYVNGSTFVNSPNPFKLGGGTWRTPSDSRLKTEIPIVNPMTHFMAKVDATKPKEFCYKDKAMTYVNRGAIERRNNYLQGVKDSMEARASEPQKIYNIHNEKVAKLITIDLTKDEDVEKEVGFIAEEVAVQIPEAIEPIQIGGQTYAGLNYEQIHMMHLATTHALMSTMEIQESTIKGQDLIIETLYANYDILRNLLTL